MAGYGCAQPALRAHASYLLSLFRTVRLTILKITDGPFGRLEYFVEVGVEIFDDPSQYAD
jgi:hypothetical protein